MWFHANFLNFDLMKLHPNESFFLNREKLCETLNELKILHLYCHHLPIYISEHQTQRKMQRSVFYKVSRLLVTNEVHKGEPG